MKTKGSKVKNSYWSKYYSPFGNLEGFLGFLFLAIFYLGFFVHIFLFLNTNFPTLKYPLIVTLTILLKIYCLVFAIIFGALIIYDLIYKIKEIKATKESKTMKDINNKNNDLSSIDSVAKSTNRKPYTHIFSLVEPLSEIQNLLKGLVMLLLLVWLYTRNKDVYVRIIMFPFLASCVFMVIGLIFQFISRFKKEGIYNTLSRLCEKMVSIIFFTFWFGFLGFIDYFCIKDRNYQMLLFSILFWIAGIFVMYKVLKKSKL